MVLINGDGGDGGDGDLTGRCSAGGKFRTTDGDGDVEVVYGVVGGLGKTQTLTGRQCSGVSGGRRRGCLSHRTVGGVVLMQVR